MGGLKIGKAKLSGGYWSICHWSRDPVSNELILGVNNGEKGFSHWFRMENTQLNEELVGSLLRRKQLMCGAAEVNEVLRRTKAVIKVSYGIDKGELCGSIAGVIR